MIQTLNKDKKLVLQINLITDRNQFHRSPTIKQKKCTDPAGPVHYEEESIHENLFID